MTTLSDNSFQRIRLWALAFCNQAWSAFRGGILSKRILLIILGMTMFFGMQVLVLLLRRRHGALDPFFIRFHCWVGLSVIVPLGSMFLGISALREDMERGGIVYILCRPVPKSAVFLGRTFGALLIGQVIAFTLISVSYGLAVFIGGMRGFGESISSLEYPAFLKAYLACALSITTLAALLGSITKRALIWGGAFVLIGELMGGAMAANTQMTALRSILVSDQTRHLALVNLPKAIVEPLIYRGIPPLGNVTQGELLWSLGRYIVICLVAGTIIFSLKEHSFKSGGN